MREARAVALVFGEACWVDSPMASGLPDARRPLSALGSLGE